METVRRLCLSSVVRAALLARPAGSLWFERSVSAFLEPAADDVVDSVDGHEGVFVDAEDGLLELVDFEARDDGVENLFFLARVAAFAVEEGDAASQSLGEGDIDFVRFVCDDHDGVGFVKPLHDDVDHLGDDEVGDERVHRLVPAEEKTGA